MKKWFYLLFITSIFAAPMAMAEDSPADICRAEAADTGIEDPEERRAYIDDCMDQLRAESEGIAPAGEEVSQSENVQN